MKLAYQPSPKPYTITDMSTCTPKEALSLFDQCRFTLLTLWSDTPESGKIRDWYETADMPRNTEFLWINNSGKPMSKSSRCETKLIDLGVPFSPIPGHRYSELDRHRHVADLYNRAFLELKHGMDFVVLVEDDTLPPVDGILSLLRLITGNTAVGAGVYRSRQNPRRMVCALDLETWDRVPEYADPRLTSPFRVGMTGGGFAIIDRCALQMTLPWQAYFYNGRLIGWDGHLGKSLTALGYTLSVDPNIRCQHRCREVLNWLAGEQTIKQCTPIQSYGY